MGGVCASAQLAPNLLALCQRRVIIKLNRASDSMNLHWEGRAPVCLSDLLPPFTHLSFFTAVHWMSLLKVWLELINVNFGLRPTGLLLQTKLNLPFRCLDHQNGLSGRANGHWSQYFLSLDIQYSSEKDSIKDRSAIMTLVIQMSNYLVKHSEQCHWKNHIGFPRCLNGTRWSCKNLRIFKPAKVLLLSDRLMWSRRISSCTHVYANRAQSVLSARPVNCSLRSGSFFLGLIVTCGRLLAVIGCEKVYWGHQLNEEEREEIQQG